MVKKRTFEVEDFWNLFANKLLTLNCNVFINELFKKVTIASILYISQIKTSNTQILNFKRFNIYCIIYNLKSIQ